MTTFDDNLLRQGRGEEDEVLSAYQDHLGYWTIGIGRLIDKRRGGGISLEESAFLFANDVKRIKTALLAGWPWMSKLSDPRFAVLIFMAFQMGVAGLAGFKNTLELVRTGAYDAAADAMLKSTWADQTPARAARMAQQMRTDTWQFVK